LDILGFLPVAIFLSGLLMEKLTEWRIGLYTQ